MKKSKIIRAIGIVIIGLAALFIWETFQNLQMLYDPKCANDSVNFMGIGVLFNLFVSLALATGGIVLVNQSRKKKE